MCAPLAKGGVFIPVTSRSAVTRPLHPPVCSSSTSRRRIPLFLFSFHFTAQRLSLHDISVMTTKQQVTSDAVDDGPPISVPDSGDTGESGKLKMIVQLVRKCMGIKDIASMWVFTMRPRVRCLSMTLIVLQEVISASIFIGTCPEPGAFMLSLCHEIRRTKFSRAPSSGVLALFRSPRPLCSVSPTLGHLSEPVCLREGSKTDRIL